MSGMEDGIRVGIRLMPMNTTIEDLRAVWKVGDDAGFDHVWGFDHFAPINSDPTGPIFEGWALLAAMAEATRRVRIGCLVTGNPYRHPAVLAKIGSTVDHLSGGRLEFGIGAGWAESEFRMLGIDYSPRARFRQLEEALDVIKLLWTEDVANYDGRYYKLTDALHAPKPVQKPHPPIWIGGEGPERTLRIAARYADVWNTAGVRGGPEAAIQASKVLDLRCEEIERDPASIRRSSGIRFTGDEDATLRAADALKEAGFSELIVTVVGPEAPRHAVMAGERLLDKLRA
jgi:F420-dependent oxidoreductase-like protein